MDPVDLIIASLDVKGAFPNTPWLLLEAVWKRLGLPFYNFASGYIRTRKYTVRTGAGLTPFLEPGSRVPQGGAEGPFLYLLVTLPLALAIEQDYPAYASCPLLSPLVGFADNTNLAVAHTPHQTHAPKASSRECAVGLVTGPHTRTPPHPQPVGSGPGQPAQRAGSRGWESTRPWAPHTKAGGAPPGRHRAAPTARKASSQERALWGR